MYSGKRASTGPGGMVCAARSMNRLASSFTTGRMPAAARLPSSGCDRPDTSVAPAISILKTRLLPTMASDGGDVSPVTAGAQYAIEQFRAHYANHASATIVRSLPGHIWRPSLAGHPSLPPRVPANQRAPE